MHKGKKTSVCSSSSHPPHQNLPEPHVDPAICTRASALPGLSLLIGWDISSSQWLPLLSITASGPMTRESRSGAEPWMDTQSRGLGASKLPVWGHWTGAFNITLGWPEILDSSQMGVTVEDFFYDCFINKPAYFLKQLDLSPKNKKSESSSLAFMPPGPAA